MGYWTNAAFIAGYDWTPSIVKSGIPWYCFGYSLTLVPLFWCFDNMVAMYRVAIGMNALWATMSFLICYSIARRFGNGESDYKLMLFSFVVSVYSSFLHQSSIAVVETFLYFTVWLLFLVFLRFEEKQSVGSSIALGLCTYLVYFTHHRTIGIVIAAVLSLLLMLAAKKTKLKYFALIILAMAAFWAVDTVVSRHLSASIWGENNVAGNDYSGTFSNIKLALSSFSAFKDLAISALGKAWYICTASFMLAFWGFVCIIRRLVKAIKAKEGKAFSLSFFALSFLAMNAISALFTFIMIYGANRVDGVIYGRYAECAAGIVLIFGFLYLSELPKDTNRNRTLLRMLCFAGYLALSALIAVKVNRMLAIKPFGLPSTQINSTPGIFFYGLVSDFSIKTCTIIALFVSVIVFLAFQVEKNSRIYRLASMALLALLFCYSADYSFTHYTEINQANNNSQPFVEAVEVVEDNLTGGDVFLESSNLYQYFDFQNRIVHNTVYPGGLTELGSRYYDAAIIQRSSLKEISREEYDIAFLNDAFVILREKNEPNEWTNPKPQNGFSYADEVICDFGEAENFAFSGFSVNEVSFRWSDASPAEITVEMLDPQRDYSCSVYLVNPVPDSVLQTTDYTGYAVINGHEEEPITFTLDMTEKLIEFQIDDSLLEDDEWLQTIEIYTPLWSPSDFGSGDSRTLGIAIDKLVLTSD